ncbi:alpha/beta-hydrolase [Mycena amicta]|nr:alpha/beta-hydrolase [Mycena amicta]
MSHATNGIKVIDRFFDLPLDYSNPSGETIRVFARNLIPKNKANSVEDEEKNSRGPGFEVDLQGSSGFSASGESSSSSGSPSQTLWIDHRGTGLSTSLAADTLPARLVTDQDKVDYFKHFRADNIVRDAEAIRKILLGHKADLEEQKWSLIGHSFGGFCAITYLSFFPEGLKEVFISGGLAPLDVGPDRVYAALIRRLKQRNAIYYQKYPQDIKRVRDILNYLESNQVKLPNGGRLSVSRFLQLGITFGTSGGIDRIHQLVFRITNDLELFVKYSFDGNPIYAILHEPLYCQGCHESLANHSQFSWTHVKGLADEPVYFSGEMVLPDAFDDFVNLRPLNGAAEILANDSSWGKLYDIEQLQKNQVRVILLRREYYDDMYVQFDLAQETAATIKNTEQYITNMLKHDAIRADPKDVMKRLFQLSKREYD